MKRTDLIADHVANIITQAFGPPAHGPAARQVAEKIIAAVEEDSLLAVDGYEPDGIADIANALAMELVADRLLGPVQLRGIARRIMMKAGGVPNGATYVPGQIVEKHSGDYQLCGEVRAVLTTTAGKIRYVVQHPPGFLHVYSDAQLRVPSENALGWYVELLDRFKAMAEPDGA